MCTGIQRTDAKWTILIKTLRGNCSTTRVCVCVKVPGYEDVCVRDRKARNKRRACVCETERRRDIYLDSGCSSLFDLQSSLFRLSVFNTLPQHWTANHFNYSEGIDLLNELTYSNLPQSHSLLPYDVRGGSSAGSRFCSRS